METAKPSLYVQDSQPEMPARKPLHMIAKYVENKKRQPNAWDSRITESKSVCCSLTSALQRGCFQDSNPWPPDRYGTTLPLLQSMLRIIHKILERYIVHIQFMLSMKTMSRDAFQKNAKMQMCCIIQPYDETKINVRNNDLSHERKGERCSCYRFKRIWLLLYSVFQQTIAHYSSNQVIKTVKSST